MLDLATGTGWAARLAAAGGAKVVGVDIGADLIEAAKERARQANLDIEFEVGDAEQLRFHDESFDVVVSTCGVMFASNPEAAAASPEQGLGALGVIEARGQALAPAALRDRHQGFAFQR